MGLGHSRFLGLRNIKHLLLVSVLITFAGMKVLGQAPMGYAALAEVGPSEPSVNHP